MTKNSTSSGKQFDTDAMTVAHKALPLPRVRRPTNSNNRRQTRHQTKSATIKALRTATKADALLAITANWMDFKYLPENLKNDRDLVLAAIQCDDSNWGNALLDAPVQFRADRELVLLAINKNGCAITYASEALKDDEELARMAVNNDWYAYTLISERLQGNKHLLKAALDGSDEDVVSPLSIKLSIPQPLKCQLEQLVKQKLGSSNLTAKDISWAVHTLIAAELHEKLKTEHQAHLKTGLEGRETHPGSDNSFKKPALCGRPRI